VQGGAVAKPPLHPFSVPFPAFQTGRVLGRPQLLSIDPLAALAETQIRLHQRLVELTPTPSPDLEAAWQAVAEAAMKASASREVVSIPDQYLLLLTCRDERHQVELLQRFQSDSARASTSAVRGVA
jgi:hypothetical protein